MRFISENCFLILSFVFYSFLFERNIMYFQKIYLKTFAEVDFYSTKMNTLARYPRLKVRISNLEE